MQPSITERQIFESAVEAYSESMYRVAFRFAGNRQQAEEIVQETFVGAWRNIDQLKDLSKMKAWLFGVLRNQCYKSIAQKERYSAEPLLEDMVSTADPSCDLNNVVQTAISQLPEEQRMPLLLVAMEGWSTKEAAKLLEIPHGTVLSRLKRGRDKLKQILIREYEWGEK